MSQEQVKVPEGWNIEKIGNIFKLYAGGTPSTSKPEYWENGKISRSFSRLKLSISPPEL